MAYRPNPYGNIRDKTYPSEIAAQRPALATRIHCEESPYVETDRDEAMEHEAAIRSDEREPSIRGSRADDRSAQFNRQLRGGAHGDR
jgi:hypothetical protein